MVMGFFHKEEKKVESTSSLRSRSNLTQDGLFYWRTAPFATGRSRSCRTVYFTIGSSLLLQDGHVSTFLKAPERASSCG